MWVRSQDKRSLKDHKSFYINDSSIYADNSIFPIGNYNSEERALEVLDLIHEWIMFNELYSHSGINDSTCQGHHLFRYEMPSE